MKGYINTAREIAANPNNNNQKELETFEGSLPTLEYGQNLNVVLVPKQQHQQEGGVGGNAAAALSKMNDTQIFALRLIDGDEKNFLSKNNSILMSKTFNGARVAKGISKYFFSKGMYAESLGNYYAFKSTENLKLEDLLIILDERPVLSMLSNQDILDHLEPAETIPQFAKGTSEYDVLSVLVMPATNKDLALGAAASLAVVSSAGLAARGWWKRRGKKKTKQMTLELREIGQDVESLSKILGVVMAPPPPPPPFPMQSKKTKLNNKKRMDMLDILTSLHQDIAFYESEFTTITQEIEKEVERKVTREEKKEEEEEEKKREQHQDKTTNEPASPPLFLEAEKNELRKEQHSLLATESESEQE